MKGYMETKKDLPANGKKTKGRVRIKMEFIHNKLRRYTTFSKRKSGIMKKAFELATLTGTQLMLLVASETGHVYTFATRKLQPMIISEAGKALIQTCLNSPDSDTSNLLASASGSQPPQSNNNTGAGSGVVPSSSSASVSSASSSVSSNSSSSSTIPSAGLADQPINSRSNNGSGDLGSPGGNHQRAMGTTVALSASTSAANGQARPVTNGNNGQTHQPYLSHVGGHQQQHQQVDSNGNPLVAIVGRSPQEQQQHLQDQNHSQQHPSNQNNNNNNNNQHQHHNHHHHHHHHQQQQQMQQMQQQVLQQQQQQQHQNQFNNLQENQHQHPASNNHQVTIQSQHNMVLVSVAGGGNGVTIPATNTSVTSTSSSVNSQLGPGLSHHNRNQQQHHHSSHQSSTTKSHQIPKGSSSTVDTNSNNCSSTNGSGNHHNSSGNNNNNQNPSTTDPRMSATGFDEPELSYNIDDDLNERAFNDCLPISICTISGSQHDTSTSIITSPRAFEQTLQRQEIDGISSSHGLQDSSSNQQQSRSQTENITRDQSGDIISYQHNNNTNSKLAPMIEKPISIQLIQSMNPMQHQQQQQHQQSNIGPHFNYNPLYTGVQNFNEVNQHSATQRQGNGSDKIFGEMNHQLHGVAEDLLNEAEYVLKDICNYTEISQYSNHKQVNSSNQLNHNNESQRIQSNATMYENQQQPSLSSIDHNSQQVQAPSDQFGMQIRSSPFADHQSTNQYGDTVDNSTQLNIDGQNQFQNQRNARRKVTQEQSLDARLLQQHHVQHQQHHDHIESQQFASNQSHLSMQNGNGFQQQQFSLGTNQIDLSEDCQGLFVEYQNNRNSVDGLEELHSLNVTNCDSDALEQHINMTSSDDCFPSHDDLSDFGISSGDNLLNILFNHNNSTSLIGNGNITTNQANRSNQPNVNVGQYDQSIDCNSLGGGDNGARSSEISKTTTTISKKPNKKGNNQSASTSKIDPKKANNSSGIGNRRKDQSTSIESSSQNKITTLNTNKRLLPKKSSQSFSQTNKTTTQSKKPSTNTNWMASPSSTSINSNTSGTMSPSSNSQLDYEDPYRQQLDNLRKKLKMDVIPIPSEDSPPTSNSNQTNFSHPQFQNTNTIITTQASDVPNTITISKAPSLVPGTTIDGNGLNITNNGNVTYVLARPMNDGQKFDLNTPVFLHTPNGLLPLSRTDRGISIPVSAIGNQQRLEFNSSTVSNSIVLSCVNGSTSRVSNNQGPIKNLIFQAEGQQQRKSALNADASQALFNDDRGGHIIDTNSAQRHQSTRQQFNNTDQISSGEMSRSKQMSSHDNLSNGNLFHTLDRPTTSQQVQTIITNLQSV